MSGNRTPPLSPALSEAELRETIETMGLLVAGVSDHVDRQSRILEKLTQTAAETRAAAFAAQKATDWERNADVVTKQVDRAMNVALGKLVQADRHTENSLEAANRTQEVLEAVVDLERARLDHTTRKRKRRMPYLIAAGVVLVITLTLLGTHFLSYWDPLCRLADGRIGTANEDGVKGCFFPEW